jgi:hypothetical protein
LVATAPSWLDGDVIGAVIIVVVLLLIPVALILTGGLVASGLGYLVKDDVDDEYTDSEYLELGR